MAAPSGRFAALASVAGAGLVVGVLELEELEEPELLGGVLVVEVVPVVEVDPLVEELDELGGGLEVGGGVLEEELVALPEDSQHGHLPFWYKLFLAVKFPVAYATSTREAREAVAFMLWPKLDVTKRRPLTIRRVPSR